MTSSGNCLSSANSRLERCFEIVAKEQWSLLGNEIVFHCWISSGYYPGCLERRSLLILDGGHQTPNRSLRWTESPMNSRLMNSVHCPPTKCWTHSAGCQSGSYHFLTVSVRWGKIYSLQFAFTIYIVNTLGSATLSIRKFRIGIASLNIVYPLLLIYALITLVAPTWCTLSCSQDKLLSF